MRHKFLCSIMFLCIFGQSTMAFGVPKKLIPNAQVVGTARLSFMFWDVYDAMLYAPEGVWSANKPFFLSLHYFRDIEGDAIADRSVHEMREQGFQDEVLLATWHAQMKAIFPNVKKGTVLSAFFVPGRYTEFFQDNKPIGSIKGEAFLASFSGIWLSEKTSEPALRQQLLGRP